MICFCSYTHNFYCNFFQLRECAFQRSCPINVRTRRFCSACRLKKCFDIGMRADMILGKKCFGTGMYGDMILDKKCFDISRCGDMIQGK